MAVTAILLSAQIALGQRLTVSGQVSEDESGLPVPGATILVKGTTNGVVTDVHGRYTIHVASDETLVCSCLGYIAVEMPVSGRNRLDFVMRPDAQMLEETVVVGYGTLKKTQLVGSVEQIGGDVLEDRINPSLSRSLQGQVPGLSIIQTDGKPTHGGNIYIRGGATSYSAKSGLSSRSRTTLSIGQGGGALVLIDGVEGTLESVNPEDVESVTVLKDASSSAIYGSRAAYGVILVTTKTAGSDKFTVNYNGAFSLNQRTVLWENEVVDDGLEYTRRFYEFWKGATETPQAEGAVPSKINIYNIPSNYLELYEQRRASGETGAYGELYDNKYLYFANTNWLSEFYKKINTTQTHSVSVSGKSQKISYSLSGRYYTQDSIYKIGKETFNQYNLRSKVSMKVRDWLTVDNNTYFYHMNFVEPIFSKKSSSVTSQIAQIGDIGFACLPIYNEDGTYTMAATASGYAAFKDGNSNQDIRTTTVSTTTGVTIEPVKDVFKVSGDFSYKYIARNTQRYVAPSSYSIQPGINTTYVSQADSYKREYDYETNHISANVVGTFTPKLGENHNLNLVAGWNLENHIYNVKTTLRTGMLYPGMTSFEMFDGQEITLKQYDSNWATIGAFARANYTLFGRYILEAALRYDANSRFPLSQRAGWFPSASAGWRISEEPWMKWAKPVVDNLKIRGNWGSLGNGNVSPYSYLETMSIGTTSTIFDGGFTSFVGMPSIVPDSLTWEKVQTWDIGLDMDLLHSRLSVSADYYIRNTKDLYSSGPELPAMLGAATPKGNYGELKTRGWEVTLAWRDAFKLAGKDFTYSVKGSLWDSRTWVTKFYSETRSLYGLYEGMELGDIWGFRTDGLFMSNEEAAAWYPDRYHNLITSTVPFAGDVKFLDIDNNKEITAGAGTVEDHGDLDRIGNIMPRYQYGINLDAKWNGIGLSLFFQGVGHRDWYPADDSGMFWGGYGRAYDYSLKNQADVVILDKSTENWTVTNPGAYWPRRLYGPAFEANGQGTMDAPNDYFLQNAAYIRLKNITLEYTIPSKLTKKLSIDKVRIYFSGENLLTFTPLSKHAPMFDPEGLGTDTDYNGAREGAVYPMLKTYTFGLNLTF